MFTSLHQGTDADATPTLNWTRHLTSMTTLHLQPLHPPSRMTMTTHLTSFPSLPIVQIHLPCPLMPDFVLKKVSQMRYRLTTMYLSLFPWTPLIRRPPKVAVFLLHQIQAPLVRHTETWTTPQERCTFPPQNLRRSPPLLSSQTRMPHHQILLPLSTPRTPALLQMFQTLNRRLLPL